jgi:UDP:flavonoid glycosyltransferase YjiC (YdhE family)
MRVLCTTAGSPSHGRAQLPLLRALLAAGHEVLVVTNPVLSAVFQENGIPVLSGMPGFDPQGWVGRYCGEPPRLPCQEAHDPHGGWLSALFQGMAREGAEEVFTCLLPLAQDFRPDLILRDGTHLGACLVAELLGVPHLPTPSGASNVIDPAEVFGALNASRARLGLPVSDDPLSVVPYGRIDCVPPAFSFARHLGAAWSYRQTVEVERDTVLPRWGVELPVDRPLVLAAVGTALPMVSQRAAVLGKPRLIPDARETLATIAEAAARLEECTVVLATAGIALDVDRLPPHVRAVEYVPQPLLLETADLFLTHGGFNSVRESLRTATPMAVLPLFLDQYSNARRVQELGVGRRISTPTPDGIATVCREVLADSGIRAAARRSRLAMLNLPPIAFAVDDLVKLVTDEARPQPVAG